MKNKKINYILLPGVILIWGLIMYKVFSGLSVEDVPEHKFNDITGSNELSPENFQYTLSLDYKDPFLGQREKQKNTPNRKPKPKRQPKPKPEQKVAAWPSVIYQGVIENKSSGASLAMVKIGNSSFIVSKGDLISELEIINITMDSVNVKFGKETKWVTK